MKQYIRPAITVAVLIFAGWYVYTHRHIFLVIFSLDWVYLPGMFGLAIVSIAINGLVLATMMNAFGIRLDCKEWYGLTAIGSMGNYVPIPQAGPAVRGLYLKRIYKFPLSTYTATMLVVYVLALAIHGAVGVAGLAILALLVTTAPWPLWLIFGLCTAFSLLLLLKPSLSFPGLENFKRGLQILENRNMTGRISSLHLIHTFVAAAMLWLAFSAIDRPTGFGTCMLLMAMVLCSGVFNVTPGNIGVAESAAWLTSSLLGQNADLAVVAFTVHRAVSLATLFTLGPVFTLVLSRQENQILSKS